MTAREDLAFVIWEMVPADEQERLLDAYAAAVRSAAFTEAAVAAAGCSDDLTPEEERPGYDGPTIDPEDRLREAIDPRVDLGRRERVIAEHRQMVTDEIVAKLRALAATQEA